MSRVAITGMGIISSIGNSPSEVLEHLRNGRSGVELVPERKELGFHSALAGTVKNFVPPEMPKSYARQMGDGGRLAVAATRQAIEDAGLNEEQIRHDRTGVVVGNSGNMRDIYQLDYRKHVLKKKLTGLALPRTMASTISANLTVLLGTRGHTLTVSSACASGATAIGHASQIVKLGLQDRVIAGGVQEGSWEYDCLFDALRVFSRREGDPAAASRPFDINRDGLVPAAGAGFVVVEQYDQAVRRGAKIYAEVIGYATNSDGEKMTTPSGDGSVRCMEMALADANLAPEQIDYVSAHATGTPLGDAAEAQGIAQVFADRPYVSATKSMTGHEVAAAGSSELIYTLLMMQHGFVAPSINIDEISEDCRGANIVANEAIEAQIRVAMSNSFGFGGVNAVLIVKQPE
jgi:3-oxoacyl-[acyl-carrier-protein] synthase-1